MSLSVIPRNIGYISTNSGQNALEISGAVDNIVEHGILKFQNNKFNGVEVIQVLAMSGMAFVLSMHQWQCWMSEDDLSLICFTTLSMSMRLQ